MSCAFEFWVSRQRGTLHFRAYRKRNGAVVCRYKQAQGSRQAAVSVCLRKERWHYPEQEVLFWMIQQCKRVWPWLWWQSWPGRRISSSCFAKSVRSSFKIFFLSFFFLIFATHNDEKRLKTISSPLLSSYIWCSYVVLRPVFLNLAIWSLSALVLWKFGRCALDLNVLLINVSLISKW